MRMTYRPLPLGAPWPAGGGARVVDAAGDGLGQVAGEGRPCWRLLTLIALTRVTGGRSSCSEQQPENRVAGPSAPERVPDRHLRAFALARTSVRVSARAARPRDLARLYQFDA